MFPKIAQFRSVMAFRRRLLELGLDIPCDDEPMTAADGSPLAEPREVGGFRVGNRWCVHPMEGWDAHADGSPSEHTLRRWQNFGRSGAKLIWGGEAVAVEHAGRANPWQTLGTPANLGGLAQLRATLMDAHRERFDSTDDLLVGLQLTHSGRFCKPNNNLRPEPRIIYHHPLLDAKFGIDPEDGSVVFTDDELWQLIDQYVVAARIARQAGFAFVDVKACHGYLLHESLSARDRPGPFGGDFAGRTRLLRTIIARIRDADPDLMIGVRLSAFDTVPYQTSDEVGRPYAYDDALPYRWGFGVDARNPLEMDLTETYKLQRALHEMGVVALNVSCGSPYYNPHIQRPAIFPPSDGYLPPEDPLVGVWRHIEATRRLKEALPLMPVIGSGYSYLQDYLPHVAQAVVRKGWADFVGIGRMVLACPQLPADVLREGRIDRKRICRTFSECTTAPRHGLVSGCYPLDPYYKALPEFVELRQIKSARRR